MFDCLPYKTKKCLKLAKAPKQVNCGFCKFVCKKKIRKMTGLTFVCKYFWGLSNYTRQKDFILKLVHIKPPERPGSERFSK